MKYKNFKSYFKKIKELNDTVSDEYPDLKQKVEDMKQYILEVAHEQNYIVPLVNLRMEDLQREFNNEISIYDKWNRHKLMTSIHIKPRYFGRYNQQGRLSHEFIGTLDYALSEIVAKYEGIPGLELKINSHYWTWFRLGLVCDFKKYTGDIDALAEDLKGFIRESIGVVVPLIREHLEEAVREV